MTSAMSSLATNIKNTFLHFPEFEQKPSGEQPSLGRARTMPTPICREVADAEAAGQQVAHAATDGHAFGELEGHRLETITAAASQSSTEDSSLHRDSLDACPAEQPSVGHAHALITPSPQGLQERMLAMAGSRFSMPDDPEDTSDSETAGPQPDICRDMTYDAFDEPRQLDTLDALDELEPQPDLCRDTTYDAFDEPHRLVTFDQPRRPDSETPAGCGMARPESQPGLCREKTFDAFDAETPAGSRMARPESRPGLCRDKTFDAFDAETPTDSRMARPESQPGLCRETTFNTFDAETPAVQQVGVTEKPAPPIAWQAQPQTASNVGTMVLPTLLSQGQPTLMFVGMPTAMLPAAPEPVKPTSAAVAPAPKASPSSRQGGRRQAGAKAAAPTTPPPAPGCCELVQDANALSLRWTIDARKLRKNERVIVSPLFDLPVRQGASVPFRLMLFPAKGAGSFRASNGMGTMLLKCEATAQESPDCRLELRFIVGRQPPRGPVSHSFAQSGVCSLPEDQQEWNFARAADQASQTVGICLEVSRR